MNTLFRFSESLKAVDDFRRLWQQLDSADSEKIVSETEKRVKEKVNSTLILFKYSMPYHSHRQAHHNPPISVTPERVPQNSIEAVCTLLKDCKTSIEENVTHAISTLSETLSAVVSAFKPSGKEHGPREAYDEL